MKKQKLIKLNIIQLLIAYLISAGFLIVLIMALLAAFKFLINYLF